ncbi:hypothetical protein [Amycolatopsis sp. NPDC098790]|uniref:hypothetical protein n=1 Tax=Amycolatopsis sp. NPDC098790 TaxID=3363939 RepID=UPI0038136CBE
MNDSFMSSDALKESFMSAEDGQDFGEVPAGTQQRFRPKVLNESFRTSEVLNDSFKTSANRPLAAERPAA